MPARLLRIDMGHALKHIGQWPGQVTAQHQYQADNQKDRTQQAGQQGNANPVDETGRMPSSIQADVQMTDKPVTSCIFELEIKVLFGSEQTIGDIAQKLNL